MNAIFKLNKNATFKLNKTGNPYHLTFNGLTKGEIIALVRALAYYDSPVSNDIIAYVQAAAYDLGNGLYTEVMEIVSDLRGKMRAESEDKLNVEKV